MGIADEVKAGIEGVLAPLWQERRGNVVPSTDDILLRDGAVNLEAAYVYADLADSSSLAQNVNKLVAAKVMRGYLNAATRLLKHYGGQVRSFDGDRVMAVFVGSSRSTDAVRAALALNWAFANVLVPKLNAKWPTLKDLWTPGHGVGVDTGTAMVVRGGVRNDNDLISVGAAPNVAAKLSGIRGTPSSYITKTTYDNMGAANKTGPQGQSMWVSYGNVTIGGKVYVVYSSVWQWSP